MLTTILGLGSLWEESQRAGKWSFYNTTAVEIHGHFRMRWKSGGKIRFNNIPGCDLKAGTGSPTASMNVNRRRSAGLTLGSRCWRSDC